MEQFDAQFADYCETSHCVGVASARGDHARATPVLCDIDATTGLVDPQAVPAAVGPRTAGIIAVHLCGQMCDMDAINMIAAPRGFVLEDAAQAHGARHRGRRAGSVGKRWRALVLSEQEPRGRGGTGERFAPTMRCSPCACAGCAISGSERRASMSCSAMKERLEGRQAALLRVKLPHLDG